MQKKKIDNPKEKIVVEISNSLQEHLISLERISLKFHHVRYKYMKRKCGILPSRLTIACLGKISHFL